MPKTNEPSAAVDEYIACYPRDVQAILKRIREVIKAVVPEAQERISYQMPGYFLNGILVWFGAFKKHIGLYPKTEAVMAALPQLAKFDGSKGSLRFPLDQPIPYDLIAEIVRIRAAENGEKKSKSDHKV